MITDLAGLACTIAASSRPWPPRARFTPGRRWFDLLRATSDYDLRQLTRLPGQRTGHHDHADAPGAFAVAQDCLEELVAAERALHFSQLHEVRSTSRGPAVGVPASSPLLTVMRRYQMTPGGLVRTGPNTAGIAW